MAAAIVPGADVGPGFVCSLDRVRGRLKKTP
jgi:hypothetical protein